PPSCPLLRLLPHELHVAHAKIIENGVEERFLPGLEVIPRLVTEHAEDVDHLLGGLEIRLEGTGHGIRDLTEMEQDLSAASRQECRERGRLVQVVLPRAPAFGRARDGHVTRRLGWRILPRLAALREPATIRHPEGSSFVLLLVHEILRREGGGPLPARAEELSWHQRGFSTPWPATGGFAPRSAGGWWREWRGARRRGGGR